MFTLIILLLASLAIGLIGVLFKLLKTPLTWALKLLLNALVGFVGLFVFNFLGSFVGISLGLNWVNALVTGLLGFPGVILLLLIKYIIL